MIKVSVIIPVYNVEEYLPKCLDSVINQTLKDIEIICIDDCSEDYSYKILTKYENKDNRINIIKNDKKCGPGIVRNLGLNASNGEYVSFIDSDDYISENYLETLYKTAKKYDVDIVSNLNIYGDEDGKIYPFQPNIYNNLEKWKKEYPDSYSEGKSNISIKNICSGKKEFLSVLVWNKLYRKKFLNENNLYYMNINSFGVEDLYFVYKIILNNPKTAYNHEGIYYYRQRAHSLMDKGKTDSNIIVVLIEHVKDLLKYCEHKNSDLVKYLFHYLWNSIFYRYSSYYNKKEIYKYIHEFLKSLDELDISLITWEEAYYNYILIKLIDDYEEYVFIYGLLNNLLNKINNGVYKEKILNDRINDLYNKVEELNNKNIGKIKLFGICRDKKYLTIILFGIKITFKRRRKL